jgi:hypothetical protein
LTEAARGRGLALALGAALAAVPLAAALIGVGGPRTVDLNLGPGDGPYVAGFAPYYEIDDKVATHWTTYDAHVALPLTIEGPAQVRYRYARMFGQTAVVDVDFDGRAVDHFEARGGTVVERTADLGTLARTPVAMGLRADSHERRDRGLKLDWIRLDAGPGARVRLRGLALVRGAALVLVVFVCLLAAGWTGLRAAAFTAPVSAAVTFGLAIDPWLTHRLLTAVPETVAVLGAVAFVIARGLLVRGHAPPEAVRALAVFCLYAFLIRAAAVNHPAFYYPDLRTHARLVEVVHSAGLDFFRSPSTYIWEHGVWRTEAYGKTYAFPYTPAFHLPFTLFALPYDALITALKLGAAAVSLVPMVLLWAMARRLGASTLGAALMVLIPTYTSRLSFAFLPALFGHAFDMALVLWLLSRMDRFPSRETFLRGALAVTACQLAYISGVMNMSVFLLALALIEPRGTARERVRRGVLILAMGLLGSALSVLLYYRDFLGMIGDVLPRIGGAHAAVSRYPIESWIAVAYARTRDFFDGVYPVLAVAGLYLLRRAAGYRVLLAWAATYLLLLLGRAKVPDVFLHGHETLLMTPLVCLAAGETLARMWRHGRAGRVAAAVVLLFLTVQGLLWQWRVMAEQLANAR